MNIEAELGKIWKKADEDLEPDKSLFFLIYENTITEIQPHVAERVTLLQDGSLVARLVLAPGEVSGLIIPAGRWAGVEMRHYELLDDYHKELISGVVPA